MKRIFVSQSEKNMGRNRSHRIVEAVLDSQEFNMGNNTNTSPSVPQRFIEALEGGCGVDYSATPDTQNREEQNSKNGFDLFNFPDITFCPYLTKCPIRKTKRCFFNSKYESCRVNKFYERWGE